MKITLTALISALVAAGIVFFLMNAHLANNKEEANLEMLLSVEKTVQKQIHELFSEMEQQVQALCDVIAAHKDFSLRILVENDRSSPVITEMAVQFMDPMGFSVLEIADSSNIILSSGHFPASAGNSCAQKAELLSDETAACMENIMGKSTLTLQSKNRFSIAGFSFYVMGGTKLDALLLKRLTPNDKVTLLLKNGNEFIGMDAVRSISPITDHTIVINDKEYLASEIDVPAAGLEEELKIYILLDK